MDERRFYILVSKRLTGEITAEENSELEYLLAANPGYSDLFLQLKAGFTKTSPQVTISDEKKLALLRNKLRGAEVGFLPSTNLETDTGLLSSRQEKKPSRRNRFLLSGLVALSLLFALALFYHENKTTAINPQAKFNNNISTSSGSKSRVKLPDGTEVILNAESKLSYPDNFIGNTREVFLEGEAFFTVTPNKQKPFIIHCKAMDIKVLGTVFNVKAYPDEKTSEATLLKGSIEVTLNNHTNEKIMLKPSEKITVSNLSEVAKEVPKQAGKTILKQVDPIPLVAIDHVDKDTKENVFREVGWTENKLMFKNESLQDIIITLQRWYGQNIIIKSDKLKEQKFTGNFSAETIVQIIQALQLSYNFSYKTENNLIIIY